MEILDGIRCNLEGLRLGLRTPRLLGLGLMRLAVIVLATAAGAVLALAYHDLLMARIWPRPESVWIVWIWYLAAWLLAGLLVGAAALAGYLLAQILFAVFIMDLMSRHTETLVCGRPPAAPDMPPLRWFFFLVSQELPRAVLPVGVSLVLFVGGWLTPLGPVLTALSSLAAAVFLAWDQTDLVPARRLAPFGRRFGHLTRHLGFHLGFGLWFLVPLANLVFLSFAPVGGTLFALRAAGEIDGPGARDAKRSGS